MDQYTLVSVLCACGGVLVSFFSLFMSFRKKLSDDGREIGTVLSEIKFLKTCVGEIHRDTRELTQSFSEMEKRLVRMEENTVQTQKRMDRFDNRVSHGHDNAIS